MLAFLRKYVPGYRRLERLPKQLFGVNPFGGDLLPKRVPLLLSWSKRPSFPFPHPWNYTEPIRILESYFCKADEEAGPGKHNRYLDALGFPPILVTRDPQVIRAITTNSGEKPGQFDRDTLPSTGIARATGPDTLLFANGPRWRYQKKLSAPPFGKTTLFQPEQFLEFETTFRQTVAKRLELLRNYLRTHPGPFRVKMEPEIKAIMLEMLANNVFGADIPAERIRHHFVPSLEKVIDHIVRDTVMNKLGLPLRLIPKLTKNIADVKKSYAAFEELTDLALAPRRDGKCLWKEFKSDASDAALRSNIKVFLAGAMEATTSYASWAISHLARHPEIQEKLFRELEQINEYTPENLEKATYLGDVLEETLRLTPALYFMPRRATQQTVIETASGKKMVIPDGTHILLDVWHANRHDDHWGVQLTGYPATTFAPERWAKIRMQSSGKKDFMHFGFGHGPRVCPGKHLGQIEVALVVGAMVKLFQFKAVHPENQVKAGVSTKPADGVLIELQLR